LQPCFHFLHNPFLVLDQIAEYLLQCLKVIICWKKIPGNYLKSACSSYCLEAVEKPATGNVSNADAEEKWIRYTHRLIPGVMKIERYGLRLAKLSLMPQEVTESADKILTHLISSRKVNLF
jgi:hypothetical protein